MEFFISNDKSLLDVDLIHNFLNNDSYWAKGRAIHTVKKSIENSLCFGVYQSTNLQQVGFARVVSDFAVFAWVMDVFILKDYRNYGLGKMLLQSIIKHEALQGLQRWGLATNDAQSLYEKFGFQKIQKPEIFMEIVNKPS